MNIKNIIDSLKIPDYIIGNIDSIEENNDAYIITVTGELNGVSGKTLKLSYAKSKNPKIIPLIAEKINDLRVDSLAVFGFKEVNGINQIKAMDNNFYSMISSVKSFSAFNTFIFSVLLIFSFILAISLMVAKDSGIYDVIHVGSLVLTIAGIWGLFYGYISPRIKYINNALKHLVIRIK